MADDYYSGTYDPAAFWEGHAHEKATWEDAQPDAPEINRLLAMVRPRSVVELGCGPGRNVPFFSRIPYVGIDIAATYLDRAMAKHAPALSWPVRFAQGDLTFTLPERDKAADLVFCDSTLQHVQPEFIRWALHEAFRLAVRWVCCIEYTEADVVAEGERGFFEQVHVFRHDYAALAAPWGDLVWHTEVGARVQPAKKEVFLWRKR